MRPITPCTAATWLAARSPADSWVSAALPAGPAIPAVNALAPVNICPLAAANAPLATLLACPSAVWSAVTGSPTAPAAASTGATVPVTADTADCTVDSAALNGLLPTAAANPATADASAARDWVGAGSLRAINGVEHQLLTSILYFILYCHSISQSTSVIMHFETIPKQDIVRIIGLARICISDLALATASGPINNPDQENGFGSDPVTNSAVVPPKNLCSSVFIFPPTLNTLGNSKPVKTKPSIASIPPAVDPADTAAEPSVTGQCP